MPEQWNNFFVMVGSGAAALAGLIFVAMSINHEIIFRNTTHKNRAINMLTGFTAIFMASGIALIGNQYLGVLGTLACSALSGLSSGSSQRSSSSGAILWLSDRV
jgi:hypothetical protein